MEGLQKRFSVRCGGRNGDFLDLGARQIPAHPQRGSNACLKSTSIDLSSVTPKFTSLNASDAFLPNILFTNGHPYNMSQMCNYQHLNIYKS